MQQNLDVNSSVMIDLHKLNHFCTLVNVGNYVDAAIELKISQSALTRSIQALEKSVSSELLVRNRGKSGVYPTPTGYALLSEGQELLRRAKALMSSLSDVEQRITQQLRFAIGPFLSHFYVDAILEEVAQTQGIKATIHVENTSTMMSLLLNREIDFYIGQAPVEGIPNKVQPELLAMITPQIFVREGHPLLSNATIHLEDLRNYTKVSGTSWNRTVIDSLGNNYAKDILAATISVDNYRNLIDLVVSSDAIFCGTLVDPERKLVKLPLPEDLIIPQAGIYSFTIRGIDLAPIAATAIEIIQALLLEQQ